MPEQTEKKIIVDDLASVPILLGQHDEYLRLIAEHFACRLVVRGNEIVLQGALSEVELVSKLFLTLLKAISDGHSLSLYDVRYAIRLLKADKLEQFEQVLTDVILVTVKGKQIKPKTLGQRLYLDAMRQHDVTFSIGPAGTGKTYLAVALAVSLLKNRVVERIVLTRPAVEAGEKLGFLPGDLQEKVDPYLRPLYDALYEFLGVETVQKYMAKGIIEIAPLAYMRGRTLDDAVIILDEAQNTTPEQMKMFLTRLGFGSKMVISGDITQVDLPRMSRSGLETVIGIIEPITEIAIIYLDEGDVVRHELVGKIIKAYALYEQQ